MILVTERCIYILLNIYFLTCSTPVIYIAKIYQICKIYCVMYYIL